MDLIDRLRAIANRAPAQIPHIQTEEAAKTAFVLPFLAALGFDVFNPLEVVPEFTADVGTKKGEKVDYAVMLDGRPIILIECKKLDADLDKVSAAQLYRYFSVTEARIAVVTDGIRYQFYSDLDEPNKMDERPFLVFSILEFDDAEVVELKRFSKTGYDPEETLSAAIELKYTRAIKRVFAEELKSPSDDLVKHFASRVYGGRMTQAVRTQFQTVVKRALHDYIGDRVSARLRSALGAEDDEESGPPVEAGDGPVLPEGVVHMDGDIVTTEEEVEAYNVVRAILREVVDADRVAMRDTKSYCGILLDNNNRRPICRLHFHRKTKQVGLFLEPKKEVRLDIETVDDLFKHAEAIKGAVAFYA